jgi:hypothetical protein
LTKDAGVKEDIKWNTGIAISVLITSKPARIIPAMEWVWDIAECVNNYTLVLQIVQELTDRQWPKAAFKRLPPNGRF